MRRPILLGLLLLGAPAAARGQDGPSAVCARGEVPAAFRSRCLVVAQAVESAQPQLGILIAGGNPTLGAASAGGLRLGVLPRVSASAKVNVVFAKLPDILADEGGAGRAEEVGLAVPALSGTASIGVFPGVDLAPTLGGIGAVDLLGSFTWLPIDAVGVDGFHDAEDTAFGLGARVGLLRESFTAPGVSLSVMYHRLGTVRYGDVCQAVGASTGDDFEAGVCAGGGDPGEFALDLSGWSTRALVGKSLLGFGLTAGLGYDRFDGGIDFGFRSACPAGSPESCFFRARGLDMDESRLSAFGNVSFTALVATVALEAGWMQGGDAVAGFPADAQEFDPGSGTLFGSVGIRVGL